MIPAKLKRIVGTGSVTKSLGRFFGAAVAGRKEKTNR
jgi:hypothetical protein